MRFIITILMLVLLNTSLLSQNIAINDNGSAPNSNAMLDVEISSNDKGILIPRLTSVQRDAISGLGINDEGLTIYNTTTLSFWYWDGTQWIELTGCSLNQEVNSSTDADQDPGGVGTSWVYVGRTSITYKTGSTPVVQSYYSANPTVDNGCKIKISRSTVNDNTTVGTVIAYAADSPYKGANDGNYKYWISTKIIVEDDASLTNSTTYYYKLWRSGNISAGEENYAIVSILINE